MSDLVTADPASLRIVKQLDAAFRTKGWSVRELSERLAAAPFGIVLERTTLSKKLRGENPTKDAEIEALAIILEVTITWPPTKIDAASVNETSTDATTAEAAAS